MDVAPRCCLLLRGSRRETFDRAAECIRSLEERTAAWIGPEATGIPEGAVRVASHGIDDLLGRSFAAVVLTLHRTYDPDVLGSAHGLVRGGGGLLLRLPPNGERPTELREKLAPEEYDASQTSPRLWDRTETLLERSEQTSDLPSNWRPSPAPEFDATADQDRVVEALERIFRDRHASRAVVTADRGRGKSAALGLALRRVRDDESTASTAVTARRREATREVFRFAAGPPEASEEETRPTYVEPAELLRREAGAFDRIVVDEAAQLSVALLQRIVDRHSGADLVFATTTHGYEGTGRGFAVRFLDWLRDRTDDLEVLELETPIRWPPGDPLETLVYDILLLDAEPAQLSADAPSSPDALSHRHLDRGMLAGDDRLLGQVFGLLVRAHYRTTPADLQRMLGAPNVDLHALLAGHQVAAVTWAAREGELSESTRRAVYRGERWIAGHALPEIFGSKLGYPDAAGLGAIRSVRTAVHPDWRRRGLGTRLIEEVHRLYDPDLFGTVFSATPGVLDFRRNLGHEIIRVGTPRGRRTGQPSVTMIRPETPAARDLYRTARRDLARKLPAQLELADTGDPLPLSRALRQRLRADLPEVAAPDPEHIRHHVAHYAFGPRTYESAVDAVERFVETHADRLDALDHPHPALIRARVVRRRGWRETARAADLPSVPAAMRGLRRAVRRLVRRAAPDLEPNDRS